MKIYFLAIAVASISGCTSPLGGSATDISKGNVTANFQYAHAGGLGTQNAGFLRPGAFYVWNQETNKLARLETLGLDQAVSNGSDASGSQTSKSVGGIEVTGLSGSLSGKEGLIKAAIGAEAVFSVDGAKRIDYNNVKGALSNYVREQLAQGQLPDLALHPRNDAYRVVVINSVLRASNSKLSIGGMNPSDGSKVVDISLNSPIGEIASLAVKAGTSTICGVSKDQTETPNCFFNVAVYNPKYTSNENTRLQWIEDTSFDGDKLSSAFRKLQ